VFVVTFALVFAALEALLLTITDSDCNGGSSHQDTVLEVGFLEVIDSLNPFVGYSDAANKLYGLVYDCLQSLDEDLTPIPNLALEWRIVPVDGEPYGSVWQYNLTRNAYWHDGERFTANDVVFTLNLCSQNYRALWTSQPYAYYIKSAEYVDEFTVRVHFWDRGTGEPIPVAWGGFIPIPIMPEHKLSTLSVSEIAWNWTGVFVGSEPPIVGTGPFKVTNEVWNEWVGGERLTLVRNAESHVFPDRGDEIRFDKLVFEFYDSESAMLVALGNGMLDAARFPPGSNYIEFANSIRLNAYHQWLTAYEGLSPTGELGCISFLADATGPNPIRADPAVRRAIAMTIDRTRVIDVLFSGLADEGSTTISPVFGQWHYEPASDEIIGYDPAAASQLLNDSGYVDIDSDGIREATATSLAVVNGWASEGENLSFSVGMPSRCLWVPEQSIMGFSRYLESAAQRIGIELSVVFQDYVIAPLCPWSLDLGLYCWGVLPPDPHMMLFSGTTAAIDGWSDTRYSNSVYDEAFNASVSALDPEERRSFVYACQRQFYIDCPYIVLAYPHACYVWSNKSFVGWGDWSSHPGRQIGSQWSASLWFDLRPVSEPVPCADSIVVLTVIAGTSAVAAAAAVAGASSLIGRRRP